MKLRLRLDFARDSKDLDVAWRDAQHLFDDALRPSLAQGWGPFRGQLLAKSPRPRDGVPASYSMQPYVVKLTAYGRPFATVVLEVGDDELGATSDGSADEAGVDLVSVTTERLFAFRRTHAFPGTCTVTPDWPTAYAEAATGLDVIADVEPAAGWLITQLANLKHRAPSTVKRG